MTLDISTPPTLPLQDDAKCSFLGEPIPPEAVVVHSAFGPPHEPSPFSESSASGEDAASDENPLGPDSPEHTPDFVAVCDDLGAPRAASPEDDATYPRLAARDFGEQFAHRLRWAHAVNSRRRLRLALATAAHFLEADVAAGPLVEHARERAPAPPSVPARPASADRGPGTRVHTAQGQSVIMAHYPTARSSDLSLERFITAVLRHNERVAEAVDDPRARSLQRSESEPCLSEAAAFARDLNKELEAQAGTNGHMMTACVGSRRDRPAMMSARRTRKGVKLDFKLFDCVEPTINFLVEVDAARKLAGHLWLNADIFAGPGALMSPLNAKEFVRLCAEKLPDAVLSLSWGASIISTTRLYTDDMVQRMIELCMCPIVQQPSCGLSPDEVPASDEVREAKQTDLGNAEESLYLTPAATCRHITFAVAAEYALSSAKVLQRLLDSIPGASLTIFSGVGSLGITPGHVEDLITTYGERRCFLDLRVSKPWRSCTDGSCSLQ